MAETADRYGFGHIGGVRYTIRERACLEFDIRGLDATGVPEMKGAGDRRKGHVGGR